MELVFGILIGLVVIVVLVVLHELGHAIAAKRSGVGVEEFGIGFPPRAWSKKLKNGVLFSLNWLPLGGFVRLQGEHDSAKGKGDYGAATFWQKTKILLAGVAINWLVAAGILTILAWIGLPQVLPNQFNVPQDMSFENKGDVRVMALIPDYPAEKSGIQEGDVIEEFAGQEVTEVGKLIDLTHEYRGETVEVVVERDDKLVREQVTLRDAKQGSVFGAGLGQTQVVRHTWAAPIVGVATTAQFTWVTLEGLGNLVVDFFGGLAGKLSFDESTRQQAGESLDRAGASVAGPIGILGTIFPEASQAGLTQILLLAAIISLTLAVINALPIPGLDGGRWFTMAAFRLFKKPLTKEREESIQMTGVLILLALIILITIADVIKLF